MSLRTMLTAAMALVALLALAAALSLNILTTHLHETATELRANVESVRLAQQTQIELLRHGRTTDPLARARRDRTLRSTLDAARAYVTSEREQEIMTEAERRLDAYLVPGGAQESGTVQDELSGQRSDALLERAYAGLEDLVEVNVVQAHDAVAEAARWDTIGSALGTSVAAALLLGVAATLLWVRGVAFRPVFATATAMQRFGAGAKDARAPESGPLELREIAVRFNEMASGLAHQHEQQMAFLAGVAHDLRNPLSALRLSTAVVSPEGPLPPEAQIRSTMALVRRQVYRLDRMVGDFLDTARIEAGHLELKLETCDAGELTRHVVELFQSTSPDHVLKLETAPDPLLLRCDPIRVEQVLNNLVSNAIKYSPRGGDILIRIAREGKHVLISVRDCGIGIPPAERARLFEPFRRSSGPASAIPGVGLGLFVSRRIAEAQGGRIDVESTPGKGSTFTLRLPVEPPSGGERQER